jgi:hypothetical protein
LELIADRALATGAYKEARSAALLRRRTLWSRRDALALRDIARLFRVGFVDHIGRLDHGLIAP